MICGAAASVNSTSGISWSHTGYHLDRMAFYIIADNLDYTIRGGVVKVER
jgi:hypothetical protein